MSTVYVLIQYAAYEGGSLYGVYPTWESAEEASEQVKESDTEENVIHEVVIGEPPRFRDSFPKASR